jgi:flagellar basal-body rod protein FlgG
MIRALYTASTGMTAQQTNIDTISNNISNVNTIGFKKQRAEFATLISQVCEYAGTPTSADTMSPTGIEVGLGVRTTAVKKSFSEGSLKETGNDLDLAITGKGFFQIELPDGTIGYTRDGAFKVDGNGDLVNSDGYRLSDGINIPPEATQVSISTDGRVSIITQGDTQAQEIGQITVANFVNPAGLHSMGNNLYVETAASGTPTQGEAGVDGFGEIRQCFLEMSNVALVEEMTDLIVGQRAYEAGSKAIKVSDEMLQTVNNLKR